MGLLDRLRGADAGATTPPKGDFARDARAMRATLDGMKADAGQAQLEPREAIRDLLAGEVQAPTRDVAWLRDEGVDPDEFYAREVGPSWDGLGEAQRAARIDGFLDLVAMVEDAGDDAGIPADMAARVRTKTLVLAWAFDEAYGYLSRLARDEPVTA